MAEETRTDREDTTREAEQRDETWTQPQMLPSPRDTEGYAFRWIRTSILGEQDNRNVSSAFREGWVPVKAEDYPEMMAINDFKSQFTENIEIGGLLLCKMSREKMKQKREFLDNKAETQMTAVDQSYLRENNPRMPLLPPERSTKIQFGGGER
jgi:hypothetical protein